MDPLKVSAQFAAFVWYSGRKTGGPAVADQAVRFARDNWAAFLPCAHEGIGWLLIRVAELDREKPGRRRPPYAALRSRKGRGLLAAVD